jgi:hypothetical protein
LAIDPSNIMAWHAFLLFHSLCLSFCYGVVRKTTNNFVPIYVNTWQRIGKHYNKSIQLKHMCWHQILFHFHRHNCVTHKHMFV